MLRPPPFPRHYSAHLVRSDGLTVVVHMDGDRHRKENRFFGKTTVEISRPDLGRVWLLDPGRGVYREMRLLPELMAAPHDPDAQVRWTSEGEERIDHTACERLVGHAPGADQPECRCWVDHTAGFRRRMVGYSRQGVPRLTVDYLQVVLGAPDPAVFDLPPGLRAIGHRT